MSSGIVSVVVIFLVFIVGYVMTDKKIWPENTTDVFSTTVVKIAAPSLAIISITDRFTRELLASSLFHLLILAFYTLLLFLTSKLLSRLLHLTAGKKTIFEVNFTFSNTIFIGLPINQIVFGKEGLPYLFTFYLVTLVSFWGLGAYLLAKASTDPTLAGRGFTGTIKKIFSPGLIGVLIGCLLVQFALPIPTFLDTALRYLGDVCVPLSLLVIGAKLTDFKKGIGTITKDEVLILIGKFIISPLYLFLLMKLFHIDGMAFKVFLLTSTMPCHMQTSILAEYYNVESAYASKLVSISTLICLVTIPIYVSLLIT